MLLLGVPFWTCLIYVSYTFLLLFTCECPILPYTCWTKEGPPQWRKKRSSERFSSIWIAYEALIGSGEADQTADYQTAHLDPELFPVLNDEGFHSLGCSAMFPHAPDRDKHVYTGSSPNYMNLHFVISKTVECQWTYMYMCVYGLWMCTECIFNWICIATNSCRITPFITVYNIHKKVDEFCKSGKPFKGLK